MRKVRKNHTYTGLKGEQRRCGLYQDEKCTICLEEHNAHKIDLVRARNKMMEE